MEANFKILAKITETRKFPVIKMGKLKNIAGFLPHGISHVPSLDSTGALVKQNPPPLDLPSRVRVRPALWHCASTFPYSLASPLLSPPSLLSSPALPSLLKPALPALTSRLSLLLPDLPALIFLLSFLPSLTSGFRVCGHGDYCGGGTVALAQRAHIPVLPSLCAWLCRHLVTVAVVFELELGRAWAVIIYDRVLELAPGGLVLTELAEVPARHEEE